MSVAYWQSVRSTGLSVPTDRRLDDLTAELTTMLGSTNPVHRDELAYTVLATWLARGVYDDLLVGLGDGMSTGLDVGLGERGTTSIFRRSYSALILGECLARDNTHSLVPARQVLEWGDRLASWYVRERDVRGFVPGAGWAHAVAHGADALGTLAASPQLGAPELTVLLDVLADRLLLCRGEVLVAGEPDRMAAATLAILRRGLVPTSVVEPWIARVRESATRTPGSGDPYLGSANSEAFLRALYVQLALTKDAPPDRHELVLEVADALRLTNAEYLSAPGS